MGQKTSADAVIGQMERFKMQVDLWIVKIKDVVSYKFFFSCVVPESEWVKGQRCVRTSPAVRDAFL